MREPVFRARRCPRDYADADLEPKPDPTPAARASAPRGRLRKMTDAQLAEAIEARRQGATFAALAEKYGVSRPGIRELILRHSPRR